jgi:hypothetical protein
MSIILEKMRSDQSTLFVSIPRNSIEHALAAQEGGADAIKMHVNITHHATGISFGTLEAEAKNLREVIEAVKIPVGLVPGESLEIVNAGFMRKVIDMGFSFIDAYSQYWPASIHEQDQIDLWAAFDSTYTLEEMVNIASYPWVDVVEASIIPVDEYGVNLSWRDVSHYLNLKDAIHKPLVIPSQRKLRPDDMPALVKLGLKNFLMGAVSVGEDPSSIERCTREFRESLRP